jgi:hypothetical protein
MNAAELLQMIGVVGQMGGPTGLADMSTLMGATATTPKTAPTVATGTSVGTVGAAVPAAQQPNTAQVLNGFAQQPEGHQPNMGTTPMPAPVGHTPVKKGGFSAGNILTALLGSNFGQ